MGYIIELGQRGLISSAGKQNLNLIQSRIDGREQIDQFKLKLQDHARDNRHLSPGKSKWKIEQLEFMVEWTCTKKANGDYEIVVTDIK